MFIEKIQKIMIQAAGEMFKEDLEPGGEYYEVAQELKEVAKATKLYVAVQPFDVYQGPFALLKTGDRIWITDKPGIYYVELKNGKKKGFKGDVAAIKKFYGQ